MPVVVGKAEAELVRQTETSPLCELRSRLECMACDTHAGELLSMLSALQEWQRCPKASNQVKSAMLKAATKLGVKRKEREADDVAQYMQEKNIKQRNRAYATE